MLQQEVNAERSISTNSLVRFSKIYWNFMGHAYARFIANGEEPITSIDGKIIRKP